MKLLFTHGWGFDRTFWAQLIALLPECEAVIDDRGYFGAPFEPLVEGPCIAVTHSFGTMRVLSAAPPGLAGVVAINGFERFTGDPGVPVRVLDRMIRRFETDPRAVLAEFHRSVGCSVDCIEPFGAIAAEPLATDLLRLRDACAPLPQVPVLAIHGDADPLLPPAMRAATFAGADVQRIDAAGGHLLPHEAPEICAAAIRGMLGHV